MRSGYPILKKGSGAMNTKAQPMEGRRSQGFNRLVTRRGFLGVAAGVAGTGVLRATGSTAPDDSLRVPPGRAPSLVVEIRSDNVVNGPTVHQTLLREMIDRALEGVTGKSTTREAWRAILHRNDVIGLKFNRSGQVLIGTSDALARAVVSSITDAGWSLDRIVCIEAPPSTELSLGTAQARGGYETVATHFESGSDQFALVLNQVTALIDIPFLKTHNITGLTCSLKNLSHGLIKHPARYHTNGCSPFIADIVSLPRIRNKLRLCLVDALRVAYDGGPEHIAEALSDEGVLLASTDPVATDAVGLALMNNIRRRHELPRIARSAADLGYLADAHRRNLGVAVAQGINVVRLEP